MLYSLFLWLSFVESKTYSESIVILTHDGIGIGCLLARVYSSGAMSLVT